MIDSLVDESQAHERRLRGERWRLTVEGRRRLAVTGKALGRRRLEKISAIVIRDRILPERRKLVARKWN